MLSIQDVAKQIYSDNPKSLYFFTGPEYGVKVQYLNQLKQYYGSYEEYDSINILLSIFKQKSILPRVPKLYIIRYDTDFLSRLSSEYVKTVFSAKILGTIVGIYESDKHEEKLDKYFKDNVVRINVLSDNIASKHLKTEFEKIPEQFIYEAVRLSKNYYQAYIYCYNMSLLGNDLYKLSKFDIEYLFGYRASSSSEVFKSAVVSKNYMLLIEEIESASDLNMLFYDMLSVYLDIMKCLEKPQSDSYVKRYLKLWSVNSVKLMFNLTYEQIDKLRNYSTYSAYNSLLYLIGLLQYKLV